MIPVIQIAPAPQLAPVVRVRPEPDRLLRKSERPPITPIRNQFRKTGRNKACPCGTGRKFKMCCAAPRDPVGAGTPRLMRCAGKPHEKPVSWVGPRNWSMAHIASTVK